MISNNLDVAVGPQRARLANKLWTLELLDQRGRCTWQLVPAGYLVWRFEALTVTVGLVYVVKLNRICLAFSPWHKGQKVRDPASGHICRCRVLHCNADYILSNYCFFLGVNLKIKSYRLKLEKPLQRILGDNLESQAICWEQNLETTWRQLGEGKK